MWNMSPWLLYSVFLSLLLHLLWRGSHANGRTNWFNLAQDELQKELYNRPNMRKAKNVILFIGDGMGLSTATAARILRGQLNGHTGEENLLEFEKFPHVALSKVYTSDRQTPDSASTATAFLCGVKTNFFTLGVDDSVEFRNCSSQHGKELTCLNDWFQADGRSVGIVTTARITHATPAAAYAHAASREWEGDSTMVGVEGGCTDIAKQLIYNNTNIRVIFGGGRQFFYPKNRQDPQFGFQNRRLQRQDNISLVESWFYDKIRRGYIARYVENNWQFRTIDPRVTDFAMGLFNPSHMRYELERDKSDLGEPSLTEMTVKAIRILQKNNKGFFLLVEAGRIDHGHHNNTAKRALYETLQLEEAVKAAMMLTDKDNTLMVVTADHSHVFNIAGYPKRGNDILGVVNPIHADELPIDQKPWTTLVYGNGPGYEWGNRVNPYIVDPTHIDFRQASAVPLSSETHSGDDVLIYAKGPMSHLFQGVKEQHYIAHAIAYAACVGANQNHCRRRNRSRRFWRRQ